MNIKQQKEFEIGGKKRLIKFGTNASAVYCEKYDIPLSKYNESLAPDSITIGQARDVIWSGLVAGAMSKGEEIDFNEYNVGDWIDDAPDEVTEKIYKLMNSGTDDTAGEKKKN